MASLSIQNYQFESNVRKRCSKCKRLLPLSQFYRHNQTKDGHQWYCKECSKKYVLGKYHSDSSYREAVLTSMRKLWDRCKEDTERMAQRRKIYNKSLRKYRKKNRSKITEQQRANRLLKKSGLRTIVWERAEGICEVCGSPLYATHSQNYAFHHLNGDHFDNRIENLILVCTKCHLHHLHSQKLLKLNC